jgi:hypothetical protein
MDLTSGMNPRIWQCDELQKPASSTKGVLFVQRPRTGEIYRLLVRARQSHAGFNVDRGNLIVVSSDSSKG